MVVSQVASITVQCWRRGAPPYRSGHESEHQRVVDRQEKRVLPRLAEICRIVAVHSSSSVIQTNISAVQVTADRENSITTREKESTFLVAINSMLVYFLITQKGKPGSDPTRRQGSAKADTACRKGPE